MSTAFQISLSIHLLGIVMWVGGLIFITRFMTVFSAPLSGAETLRMLVRRTFNGFVLSGLVLAAVTGVYQVLLLGVGALMKQGWFHTKLTLVLVLIGLTIAAGVQAAKIARGETVRRGLIGMLHGLSSACLLIIILLTILGR